MYLDNRDVLLQLFNSTVTTIKSSLPGGGVDLKTGGLPLDEGVQSLTQISHHLENKIKCSIEKIIYNYVSSQRVHANVPFH